LNFYIFQYKKSNKFDFFIKKVKYINSKGEYIALESEFSVLRHAKSEMFFSL